MKSGFVLTEGNVREGIPRPLRHCQIKSGGLSLALSLIYAFLKLAKYLSSPKLQLEVRYLQVSFFYFPFVFKLNSKNVK